MPDLRTLKDRAAEHARKGRFDKAVELLSIVCTADPKDLAARQKLGDAHRRAGDGRDAVHVYRDLADAYAAQGELLKAIAVWKVILDVDPKHPDAQGALAALHERRKQEPSRPVGVTPGRGLATGVVDTTLHDPTREITLEVELLAGPSRTPEPEPDQTPAWLERGSALVVPPPTPEVAAARAAALGAVTHDLSPEEPPELEPEPLDEELEAEIEVEPEGSLEAEAAPAGAASLPEEDEPLPAQAFAEALAEVRAPFAGVPSEDEPATASPALPHVPLFSDLSREAFLDLAARLVRREAAAGSVVLAEGDQGRNLYVVVAGALRVEKARPGGPLVLARLGEGDFFGEMALLSGEPRMASVVAEEDALLLEIGADALAELCRAHRSVALSLTRFYRQRLLANAMSTSPLFVPFSAEDRAALAARFRTEDVKPGDVLVREGERSQGLHVALAGRFEVVRGAGPGAQRLARLREGDLFGEMSCLRRQPAAASVVATRRGLVLRLPREDFQEVATSYPQVLELVSGLADEREQSLAARAPAPAGRRGPYVV